MKLHTTSWIRYLPLLKDWELNEPDSFSRQLFFFCIFLGIMLLSLRLYVNNIFLRIKRSICSPNCDNRWCYLCPNEIILGILFISHWSSHNFSCIRSFVSDGIWPIKNLHDEFAKVIKIVSYEIRVTTFTPYAP